MNTITRRIVRINNMTLSTADVGLKVFPPNQDLSKRSFVSNFNQYKELYRESCDNPQAFWQNVAKQFYWKRDADPAKFFEYNFDIRKGPVFIRWMAGAKTNVCFNLVDRHVAAGRGDAIAFYW